MFNLLESLPEVLRPRLIGLFLRKSRCLGYFSKHSPSLLSSHIYSLGTSVSTVLHYYHLTLNFCQMNQVLGGYFFRVSLFGKYFISFFFFSWKVFFWGRSAIPNSTDPCLLVSHVHPMGFKISVHSRSQFFYFFVLGPLK